jgi:hypothetical protein
MRRNTGGIWANRASERFVSVNEFEVIAREARVRNDEELTLQPRLLMAFSPFLGPAKLIAPSNCRIGGRRRKI